MVGAENFFDFFQKSLPDFIFSADIPYVQNATTQHMGDSE